MARQVKQAPIAEQLREALAENERAHEEIERLEAQLAVARTRRAHVEHELRILHGETPAPWPNGMPR